MRAPEKEKLKKKGGAKALEHLVLTSNPKLP